MTKRTVHRLVALWIFAMLWYFVPGAWLFNKILMWGVMVIYWVLVSLFVASLVLIPFNDWIEDRLEDD